MKIPATLSTMWADMRNLPKSTLILGISLAAIFSWETAQTVRQACAFLPNAPSSDVADLHTLYLPCSPNDHNNLNPKVDWYGLEEHLPYCSISAQQSAKLVPLEKKALTIIKSALEAYTHVTDSLNAQQIDILLRPQNDVAAIHSLGLDCGSREHQLVALHALTERSGKTGEEILDAVRSVYLAPSKANGERSPEQKRQLALMDPTRLLVSLGLMVDDAQHPITPEQATSVLQNYAKYCYCLENLYRNHDEALEIFDAEMLQMDTGLPPRIWESSSSPSALKMTAALIEKRLQGAAQ